VKIKGRSSRRARKRVSIRRRVRKKNTTRSRYLQIGN
jgi:hypothetical protein